MNRTEMNLEQIAWENHIKELLKKDESKLTKDELRDIEIWNEENMRSEFTMVGGF